jgi:predicted NBD/HSP70 family sugar kinase
VHEICDDLIARGLAVEEAPPPGGGPGRRPRVYAARADAAHVVGVDMGETTVRVAVADLRGDVVGEALAAFDDPRMSAARRLVRVRDTVAEALRSAGVPPAGIFAAVLGVPAPVTASGHAVAVDAYLPGLARVDLRTALHPLLDRPVMVENDADLAVLAERWRGVAAGCADAVLVLAGERLGAGICVDGRLVRGQSGGAGEMGFLHLVTGVGAPDGIGRLLRRSTGRPAPAAFAAVARGEPAATAALGTVAERIGRVLAILATLLDPQMIVVGGAVAEAGDVLMGPLHRAYAGALRERPLRATPALTASSLAERGTVLGAVRVALDDLVPRLLDLDRAGATMG